MNGRASESEWNSFKDLKDPIKTVEAIQHHFRGVVVSGVASIVV